MLVKRIAYALMCAVAVASAQADTMGMMGVTRVSIPPAGGVNLVGFNFTSTTPLYLEDVFGDQLTASSRSIDADKVFIWNGTSYDAYFQKTSGGPFYNVLSGQQESVNVPAGTALFLKSFSGATLTNDIYLSGAVLLDASVQKEYQASFTTIANPYPTALDLNDPGLVWSSATGSNRSINADRIYIWNSENASYDAFYLDGNHVWQELVSATPNPVIPAGGGAFYKAQTAFTNDIFKTFTLE